MVGLTSTRTTCPVVDSRGDKCGADENKHGSSDEWGEEFTDDSGRNKRKTDGKKASKGRGS